MKYWRIPCHDKLCRTHIMLGQGQITELRSYGLEASSVVRTLLDAHLSILNQMKGPRDEEQKNDVTS